MRFISSRHLLAATLFVFATAAAHADNVTFTGTATGYFGTAPGSSTDGGLTFTGSSFSGTTNGNFLSFSASGNDFGAFTDNGQPFSNETFTLNLLFTAPTGIDGGQTVMYDATMTGAFNMVNGSLEIDYTDGTQSFTSNSGPFTLTVHGVSINPDGVPVQETGSFTVSPTPEPSSLVLLGTGVLGLAGAVRRKLSKV